MELADRNLWDRFRECRDQGLPGIPREELLRYMEEAAEVLDLMNDEYQLQHLDIKPQNLFLVHNHVKVADFGLVKDLEGMTASVTGGVTPVYAAPETFDGWVSRFCDQYSLAIVYQELLTGQSAVRRHQRPAAAHAARARAAGPDVAAAATTSRSSAGPWPRSPTSAFRLAVKWSPPCRPLRRRSSPPRPRQAPHRGRRARRPHAMRRQPPSCERPGHSRSTCCGLPRQGPVDEQPVPDVTETSLSMIHASAPIEFRVTACWCRPW